MEIKLILGALGAVQSFFMSLFIFLGKKRNTQNILLCLLFLFLTIRVFKSTLWLSLDVVPNIILNIGFLAHLCTGPVLLLYLKYFFSDKSWRKYDLLHFLPAIILVIFVTRINESNFWFLGGYSSLLFHQITYTIISGFMVMYYKFLMKASYSRIEWFWILLLVLGISGIQMAYFSNYILGLVPYSIAPTFYAVFIFFLSLFAVLNQSVFQRAKKYSNIKLNKEELDLYLAKIDKVMKEEKLFLNNNFTLTKLSKKVALPLYLTSHILNDGLNLSFSDYLNSFRIKEAKVLLLSEKYRNVKISEIAYECGFNSLSTFNSHFKKSVNLTPSQYRNGKLSTD